MSTCIAAEELIWIFYALVALSASCHRRANQMAQDLPCRSLLAVVLLGAVTLGSGAYIAYAGGRVRHREFRNEPRTAEKIRTRALTSLQVKALSVSVKGKRHCHSELSEEFLSSSSDSVDLAFEMFRLLNMPGYAVVQLFNANELMTTEIDRAERSVEEQSVVLKKPLGLGRSRPDTDCVCGWLKLGRHCCKAWNIASLFLAARHFTFLHSASRRGHLSEPTNAVGRWNLPMGKARFQRIHRLHRRMESLALIDHGDRLGRNVHHDKHLLCLGRRSRVDARQSNWCVSLISCVLVSGLGWTGVRGLSLGKWVHNIGGFAMFLAYGALIVLPFVSLARGDLKHISPASNRRARDVALLLLQHLQQTGSRRTQRI